MNPTPPKPDDTGIKIRPHTYDGIQEYDQRLPNWWLYTLYGSIVFFVACWFLSQTHVLASDREKIDSAMNTINAAKMASSIDITDNDKFWEMSRNPVFVDSGRQTFNSLCVACHLASLRGKSENPAAVGPDLTDTTWIHGGTPKEIYHTVSQGVAAKGMPAWEPVLGQKKTVEVVAFVLSHHQPGDPVVIDSPPK
jgi:cytochrome c oxidase cbb3-type subunit 3